MKPNIYPSDVMHMSNHYPRYTLLKFAVSFFEVFPQAGLIRVWYNRLW